MRSRPKRKTAKRRPMSAATIARRQRALSKKADKVGAQLRALLKKMPPVNLGNPVMGNPPMVWALGKPAETTITRSFLIRLAAAHAALIVSRAEGRDVSGYLHDFTAIIAAAAEGA